MPNGIYAGTFDPMTIGHMDIIKRASKVVSTLYVAVAESINKGAVFSLEERVDMAERYVKDELDSKNIKIIPFTGLLSKVPTLLAGVAPFLVLSTVLSSPALRLLI